MYRVSIDAEFRQCTLFSRKRMKKSAMCSLMYGVFYVQNIPLTNPESQIYSVDGSAIMGVCRFFPGECFVYGVSQLVVITFRHEPAAWSYHIYIYMGRRLFNSFMFALRSRHCLPLNLSTSHQTFGAKRGGGKFFRCALLNFMGSRASVAEGGDGRLADEVNWTKFISITWTKDSFTWYDASNHLTVSS